MCAFSPIRPLAAVKVKKMGCAVWMKEKMDWQNSRKEMRSVHSEVVIKLLKVWSGLTSSSEESVIGQVDELDCVNMVPLSRSLLPYILKIQPTREREWRKESWQHCGIDERMASRCSVVLWSNSIWQLVDDFKITRRILLNTQKRVMYEMPDTKQ